MPPLVCHQEGHRTGEHQEVYCSVYWGPGTQPVQMSWKQPGQACFFSHLYWMDIRRSPWRETTPRFYRRMVAANMGKLPQMNHYVSQLCYKSIHFILRSPRHWCSSSQRLMKFVTCCLVLIRYCCWWCSFNPTHVAELYHMRALIINILEKLKHVCPWPLLIFMMIYQLLMNHYDLWRASVRFVYQVLQLSLSSVTRSIQ